MPSRNSHVVLASKRPFNTSPAQFVRVHFKTLDLPPIKDGVVIGRGAPVAADVLLEMLKLVSTELFLRLPIEDDLIADVLIRESVLRKIPADEIRLFILEHIKPSMAEAEVIAIQMKIEVLIADAF